MDQPTPEQIAEWDRFAREFREHGFLAPSLETVSHYARTANEEWFQYSEDLNTVAQAIYVDGTALLAGKSTLDPVAMGLQLMPRALSAFQGAYIMAERAMTIESKTLSRMIYELAFWIGYLNTRSSAAVPQLRHETLKSEIGLFKASLSSVPFLDALTKRQVNDRIKEMEIERDSYPSAPKLEKIARLGGFGPQYLAYKNLSNGAAHVSLKSTALYLGRDEYGVIKGHEIGPDYEGTWGALHASCYGLMTAVEALRRLANIGSYDAEFKSLLDRFDRMAPYRSGE